MADYDYDFFVIGAGSGGVRASRIAAAHGARVAVAEDRYLGGTCVNVGCVPKKLLVYASHFGEDFEDAAGFGWAVGERKFDWSRLIANKNDEIARLNGVYRRMLEASGVAIIDGTVRLADAHTVVVGDARYSAEYILVAVGGWPVVPDVPGKEHAITSNEAFFLDALPERVIVVGGGYISVEFAGIFHGLGAEVAQLYRGPLFLRGFDDDVRGFLAAEMRKKAIDLRFDTSIESLARNGGAIRATLTGGVTLEADLVMYATGRAPNTAGLGLEEAGIALDAKGAVVVDAYSKSSVDNIYAVGDVTDRINLTPVAIREGHAVADTLFGGKPTKPRPRRRAVGGVQPAADRQRRPDRGPGARAIRRRRCLQEQLPGHEAHAWRPRRGHLHEADRRAGQRPRGRLPHDRARGGRDHPGHGRRREVRRHQGPVRRHRRHPPDHRRGIRHAPREGARADPRRPRLRARVTAAAAAGPSIGFSTRHRNPAIQRPHQMRTLRTLALRILLGMLGADRPGAGLQLCRLGTAPNRPKQCCVIL